MTDLIFLFILNKISRDFNYLLVVLFIVLVMRLNIPDIVFINYLYDI